MIQKLRIRFVIFAMSALTALLVLLVGGINFASYTGMVSDADRVLLSEDPVRSTKNKISAGAEGFGPNGFFSRISPEIHNYTRFSFVTMTEDGNIIDIHLPPKSFIEKEELADLAQRVYQNHADSGFENIYRYLRRIEGDVIHIRFLDCGREIGAFRQFLLTSMLLSAAGLLVILGIMIYVSGKIVRPFAESYEKQKQFITDAGHEIKTPLTIIQADSDVLEMEIGENEWLADIQRNVRSLRDLTDDLISLARMEEGSAALKLLEIPVSDVVAEKVQTFYTLAQAQKKELHIDVEPMVFAKADEKAISKLVGILMDNALKYSPEGSTVSLELKKQGKKLKLSVENKTAAELPEGDLKLLFERFYRSDPSRNSETGGHGIGLSIAAAIAAAHNGQIQALRTSKDSLQILVTLPQSQITAESKKKTNSSG